MADWGGSRESGQRHLCNRQGELRCGVDVGSIEYIHKQLIACRDRGNAVLIISSELDEILDLSDRIYVMFEGRIAAEFDNSDRNADRGAIGLAMAGVAEGGAA